MTLNEEGGLALRLNSKKKETVVVEAHGVISSIMEKDHVWMIVSPLPEFALFTSLMRGEDGRRGNI